MGISDKIEAFITELMKADEEGFVELKRNELASIFNCVPSQINYVISTRFSPERGYIVESRRGGGGYLRIRKTSYGADTPAHTVVCRIGDSIDYQGARSCILKLNELDIIDDKTAEIMIRAVSDNSLTLPQPQKDELRAGILKNMISAL